MVKVWDSRSGKELLTCKGHHRTKPGVCFSPDGTRLASAGGGIVKVWDSTSGQELLTINGSGDGVCFSPDGTRLASVCELRDQFGVQGEVKVWDCTSGQELLALRHTNWLAGVCFSPDGTRLAAAGGDGTVKVWDSRSAQELFTLRGHIGWVRGVCFNPDGTRLASAGQDQTVKVWDSTNGQELLTLKGHTHWVLAVCFSPDGTRLASAGYDGTVRVWESRPVPAEALRKRDLLEKVDSLYSRFLAKKLVTRELLLDPWLSEPDRQFALQAARTYSENPAQLNDAAWKVVRAPGGRKEAYALALRQAEAAMEAVVFNDYWLQTLGVAHYRLGDYAKALHPLTACENAKSSRQEGSLPADLAFLAMAQHQLGRKDEAKATLARLRDVMKQPRWANDAEAQGFLHEADHLIEGKPASEKK
jgi:hypothetical protein